MVPWKFLPTSNSLPAATNPNSKFIVEHDSAVVPNFTQTLTELVPNL